MQPLLLMHESPKAPTKNPPAVHERSHIVGTTGCARRRPSAPHDCLPTALHKEPANGRSKPRTDLCQRRPLRDACGRFGSPPERACARERQNLLAEALHASGCLRTIAERKTGTSPHQIWRCRQQTSVPLEKRHVRPVLRVVGVPILNQRERYLASAACCGLLRQPPHRRPHTTLLPGRCPREQKCRRFAGCSMYELA
jgi:hypothetical protein